MSTKIRSFDILSTVPHTEDKIRKITVSETLVINRLLVRFF